MGRHSLSPAEQGFFDTVFHDGQSKFAVELDPDSADALGIPSVSPSVLSGLEEQAKAQAGDTQGGAAKESPKAKAPAPAAVDAEAETPALDVDNFQRVDAEPEEEVVAAPDLPSRATHGKLFSDKRAHPVQLLEVLTMRYKTDWSEWESDTLWWALRRSFGPVGEVTRNKIMALRLAATTDVPWLDWDVFEDCGLSWNDIVPSMGTFQPMTPMQAAFTVQVLREIRPDDEFAHEVKAYMAAILDDHGWVWAPDEWFDGAQEVLEKNREHLVGLKNDVKVTWEKVRTIDPATVDWNEDDPRDIHILKMFVVQFYLQERAALREVVPGASVTSSTTSPPVP